jgi:hypothetical protein
MPQWKRQGTSTAVLLLAGVMGLLILIVIAILLYRSQQPAPHSPENPKVTGICEAVPPQLRAASNHRELLHISLS